jgi:hypothetical protein
MNDEANQLAAIVKAEILSANKISASTKMGLRQLYFYYQQLIAEKKPLPNIWDVGFRIFSQFDEDGVIHFLLAVAGIGPRKYVDIGCGDGYYGSNTANLSLNLGFHGLGIDGDEQLLKKAHSIFSNHSDTFAYPPKFVKGHVIRENINELISENGFSGEVDVLSIDIDGNDYWVWEAINCISPRIVVIETHVEFGLENIVVPYDKDYVHPGKHPQYHGASPIAMEKLGKKLGYRLVGANRLGFNFIFLRKDLAPDLIPGVKAEDVLWHQRNAECHKLFDEIRDYPYLPG